MRSYALIVDPDHTQAVLYAAVLRDEGLSPVIVRDGAYATSMFFERGTPSVLLTELSLPRVDGFELIEKLRKIPKGGDKTPVIVVSASRELRETAADLRSSLGIGAILAKAASDESLRRVLKRVLGLPALAETPANEPPASAERESCVRPVLRAHTTGALRRNAARGRS